MTFIKRAVRHNPMLSSKISTWGKLCLLACVDGWLTSLDVAE
jgi:hypothetical protein